MGAETMFWQISKELGVNQQSRALVDALSGLVWETLPELSNNLKAVPIEILCFFESCLNLRFSRHTDKRHSPEEQTLQLMNTILDSTRVVPTRNGNVQTKLKSIVPPSSMDAASWLGTKHHFRNTCPPAFLSRFLFVAQLWNYFHFTIKFCYRNKVACAKFRI